MEHFDYYVALGEETFFCRMTADRLQQVATYRSGKSFRDFAEAIYQGCLDGLGVAEREFGCIARRLYDVVEIDTKEDLGTFTKRLANSRERKFCA